MGMDVFGKNPTNSEGKYFRNNVWYWKPLWAFCCSTAPEILTDEIATQGTLNEGHGLDAVDSATLAERLNEAIQSGKALEYEKDFYAYLETIPRELCPMCPTLPKLERQDCLRCKGAGVVAPYQTSYGFSTANVKEFAQFLRHCGGFEIW